jgi:hypothetical protein
MSHKAKGSDVAAEKCCWLAVVASQSPLVASRITARAQFAPILHRPGRLLPATQRTDDTAAVIRSVTK